MLAGFEAHLLTTPIDFKAPLAAVGKHGTPRIRRYFLRERGNPMAIVTIIVDGLAAAADGAVAALRQSGHDVATVGTALAIAALMTRPPDVVVLHGPMSLPDGLMALEVLRARAGLDDLAGVLVSTGPTAEQIARGGRCGAWRVIDRDDYGPGTLVAAVDGLTRAS